MIEAQKGYQDLKRRAIETLDNWLLTFNTLSGLFSHGECYRWSRGGRRDGFQWDLSNFHREDPAIIEDSLISIKLNERCAFDMKFFELHMGYINLEVKYPKINKFNFNKIGTVVGRKQVLIENLSLDQVVEILNIIYDFDINKVS